MKRRLWFLNIVLIAILVMLGTRFRTVRDASRERAAKNLNQRVVAEKAPVLPKVPPVPPVTAANYVDVAIKMLLSRDRNPTVILDPVVPPPEKPMPPLPTAYGAMFFGEPAIILSASGKDQRSYRKGDTIGEFKLVDFDNQSIRFEWDGKTIDRRLDEIMAQPSQVAQSKAPAAGSTGGAAAPPPAKPASNVTTVGGSSSNGPGVEVGGGSKACVAGDTSPPGAVRDGYKKVEAATPFGKSCQWVPAQ